MPDLSLLLPENLHLLAVPAAIFLLAGLVKGVIGMGLPTVAMALLALSMTPAQAAALLILPSFLTNLWQAGPLHTALPLLRRLAPLLLSTAAGTLIGAWLIGAPAGSWARMALGSILALYAVWTLMGRQGHVPAARETSFGLAAGGATGLVTAATGVFVLPSVPYLQSLGLSRDELIQAMGLSFTVSTIFLAAGLVLNQAYPMAAAGASLLMLVPAILGMQLGQWLRVRIAPPLFRRLFLGSLLLLGLHMLIAEL